MPNWKFLIDHDWENLGETADWKSSWEFGGAGATSAATLADVMQAVIAWERRWTLTPALFTRARVGAYAPIIEGYDPYRFTNIPIGLNGLRNIPAGQENVDLEIVWKLNRTATTGNGGFVNGRGMLLESETTARASGKPRLNPNTPFVAGGAAIQDMQQSLAQWLQPGASIFIAMIGEYKIGGSETAPIYGPTVTRRVGSFTVRGAARLKMTKKKYQRRGPDVGDGVDGGGGGGPFVQGVEYTEPVDTLEGIQFNFGPAFPDA